jgi:hypothetical protein
LSILFSKGLQRLTPQNEFFSPVREADVAMGVLAQNGRQEHVESMAWPWGDGNIQVLPTVRTIPCGKTSHKKVQDEKGKE